MGEFSKLSSVAVFAVGAMCSQARAGQTVPGYDRRLPPTHDIDNKVFMPWFGEAAAYKP